MVVKLGDEEVFTAELVFHVDHTALNQIIKEEVAKAMANIDERIEQYLISHIRAERVGKRL